MTLLPINPCQISTVQRYKQIIWTNKNENWNASTVQVYFTFFNREKPYQCHGNILRVIPLSLQLLLVVIAYTIHVIPQCPFEIRLLLPCSSEFEVCPSLVQIPRFSKLEMMCISSKYRICPSASPELLTTPMFRLCAADHYTYRTVKIVETMPMASIPNMQNYYY